MARLQILELPEGAGDDRAPFVLVVDECIPQRIVLGSDAPYRDYWQDLAQQIGAHGVIVTPETIDIPANEVPLDENGQPLFLAQVQDEIAKAQANLTRSINRDPANELTDIARDMDRLANHKAALLDALGMDPTRDWDDIRNAAAGIRKHADGQAAELERLRAGEEPVTDERATPTPGQWIWHFNRATPQRRLDMAAQILDSMPAARNCFLSDHEAQITHLQAEVERLRPRDADA